MIDIARIQCRHTDAAIVDCINAEFFTQAPDLIPGQARERKHAALVPDKAEIERYTAGLQLFDELVAHLADALAHAGEFIGPESPQFGGVQHRGNQGAAMRGRV